MTPFECARNQVQSEICQLSLLVPSLMTELRLRMAKSTACWAAHALTSRWPPVISPRPRSSPWWATISPGEDEDLLADRGIDLEGLERVPGKTFFWAGVYSARHERSHHAAHRSQRLRRFQPKLPESYQHCAVPDARQHPADIAAQRARADERPAPGRRRHHELLDQGFSRRTARRPSTTGIFC